jgi:membrane protease YdiL (CAAX protease family)
MEPQTNPGDGTAAWTVGDFAIAVLFGFAGALIAGFLSLFVEGLGGVLVLTLVGQYSGHVLGVLIVVRRRRSTLAGLGLDVHPRDGIYLLFGIALQFAVVILFAPLAVLLDSEGGGQALTEVLPEVQGTAIRVVLVLSVAFVAPIVEELMFRGLLYRVIERWRGPAAALFGSAMIFSLFHLLGIGTQDPLTAAAVLVPQLFLVGIVLARQVQRHGRLGPAIFTHAGFNLIAVVALFVAPNVL